MFTRNDHGFSGLFTPQSDHVGDKSLSRSKTRCKLAYVRKVGMGVVVGTKEKQDACVYDIFMST